MIPSTWTLLKEEGGVRFYLTGHGALAVRGSLKALINRPRVKAQLEAVARIRERIEGVSR